MTARISFAILCLTFLIMGCSDENTSGPNIEPEGLQNMVSVGSDSVRAQSKFSVDVTIENKDELTGIAVPLSFSGENFSIDSISFIGSRFDIGVLSGAQIYPDDNKIVFWHYPDAGEVIDSGSGVAFKVFLWVWGNAPTQDIVIDTTTVNTSIKFGYTDPLYNNFVPDFEQGIIHVDAIQPIASRNDPSDLNSH